jgi:hypothetical protein
MLSFQCRELLAKSEVFEKQPATTVEESEDRTRQKHKRVYHVRVLSRFACEWQCRILLKSQTDGILARDNPETQLRELREYAQLTHPFCGKRIPGG